MFLRWVPIIFSSMYDDMALSTYISTKEFISKHLKVREHDIYHSGTSYAIGFWVGGLLWNILARCWSVKRILFISQLMMIIFTICNMFQASIYQLFLIRFMQGVWGSGVFIAINILVKHNLSQNNFNKFLALNAIFVYLVEAAIPIIMSFLNEYNFQFSLAFLVFILLVSMFTNFLNFSDVNERNSILKAIKVVFKSYFDIISSKLFLILLIVGISEAMVDVLFNVFDQIMANCNIANLGRLKNISISIISLCSSAAVLIIPYFSPDPIDEPYTGNKFDWRHLNKNDKKIIYWCVKILAAMFLLNLFNPFPNHYYTTMFCIISIMVVLCIIHYIGVKIMHSVYYSSGCIASTILLSETFFAASIQGSSQFLAHLTDNRMIFGYAMLYILILYILTKIFFRRDS